MFRETIQTLAWLSVLSSAYSLHMTKDSYRQQSEESDSVPANELNLLNGFSGEGIQSSIMKSKLSGYGSGVSSSSLAISSSNSNNKDFNKINSRNLRNLVNPNSRHHHHLRYPSILLPIPDDTMSIDYGINDDRDVAGVHIYDNMGTNFIPQNSPDGVNEQLFEYSPSNKIYTPKIENYRSANKPYHFQQLPIVHPLEELFGQQQIFDARIEDQQKFEQQQQIRHKPVHVSDKIHQKQPESQSPTLHHHQQQQHHQQQSTISKFPVHSNSRGLSSMPSKKSLLSSSSSNLGLSSSSSSSSIASDSSIGSEIIDGVRDGSESFRGGGPMMPSMPHGIASQLMLRSARGQRQYDVPQIECPPAMDGMERFACPTPDRQGRYRCIDDHVLCNGFIDCPAGEDEERQACMFYKTTKAHLDVLADALLRWARGR